MEQKIRRYLDEEELGWVILDSIPQARLVSIMSRLNIEYPGTRMSSIPLEDLAYDLAEEAFAHKEVMEALIKVLFELNSEEVEKISQMSDNKVKLWIREPKNIYLDRKIGKIIWGLISDLRQNINELIPEFLRRVKEGMAEEEHFFKQMDKEAKQIEHILSTKKEIRRIKEAIPLLRGEIDKEKRISADLQRMIQRLTEKNIEQQNLISQLRRDNGELIQEKGSWHKEMTKREAEIQDLCQQIKDLKVQLAVGPKMRLKAEIRHLEKENEKLNYALENQQRQNENKMDGLERELLQVREDTRQTQQVNQLLQEQLEIQKQRFEKLQNEYQLISVKKEPLLPPKEKGRRLGIFIDNQNVYYSARIHYGKKLDFRKLLEAVVKDRHLVKAICYVVYQPEVSQEGFINMLKNNGYTVRKRELIRRADGTAKGNWDIGIAVDIIEMVEKNSLDIIALVTCDGDFVDLIKLLSIKGIKTEVVGFPMNMAMDLKKEADEYYFITEDLMIVDT